MGEKNTGSLALVILVYGLVYLPVALVVLTSFNAETIATFPIETFSLKWFDALISNTRTLSSLWVSIKLGVLSSIVATVLGLCAALAVTRYEFAGRHAFLILMTFPMVAPGIVLGVSLLIFARQVGLKTGFGALMLGHTLLSLPYCTFIIISSLARFDKNLEDAARGLGASEFAVLRRITLPGISSGILGALLFGFTISIGEFVVSFFLTSPGVTTLPIRIYSIVKVGITPEINAVSTIILVATLVLTVVALNLTWTRNNSLGRKS
jgi:spermidine/putrescine transport system permease protein